MVFTITRVVEDDEDNKGSTFKQYALAFIVSLLFFNHGVESHNLTISVHSGHFKTSDDVPWTTIALLLGAIFSLSLHGYLIDIWGRKFGIYLVILLQGASCIPFLITPNDIGTIIVHALTGVSTAAMFLSVPIYIREIIPTRSRGLMICLSAVMTCCGYLVKLVMSTDKMLYLIAAMVLFEFCALIIVLESPSYLVRNGKIEKAKINMAKLKCLSPEDLHVTNKIKVLTEESERAKPNGKFLISSLYRNKIYWDEIKVGFMLSTITVLGGSILFLDQDKTLVQLKTSGDTEKALVLVCMTAGALVCVTLIEIVQRKYLLTFGYSIMVLSMGTLAVFTQADLTVTSLRWLPVAAHYVLIFGYGLTWCLPIVILVEMLNLEIRATVLAIIFTYAEILRLVHILTLKKLEELFGVYTLFYIFACINLYGAIYALSVLPNINNKTVRQIERQMKRIPILK
ncbi:unnamed protein product [Danaus chrysippus]|uniref:(African queen) hypothetical protein n=1 Tax=Danaus chrysippus TaxID=151541 RepID=A0A8J2R3D0_9NEOP|nr:unnamed protein product [Danaus chrysippus]